MDEMLSLGPKSLAFHGCANRWPWSWYQVGKSKVWEVGRQAAR